MHHHVCCVSAAPTGVCVPGTPLHPIYDDNIAPVSADRTVKCERGHTRRSAPELFSAAQSSGLCPGARTTFSRFLDLDSCVGAFVVDGGGIREEDEDEDGTGGPGIRRAGVIGGGIRVDGAREMRCELSMAGKAGGESSSGLCTEKDGFVGVVGDSSSSSLAEASGLLC